MLAGHRVQQMLQRTLHRLLQDIPSGHWTPRHIVSRFIDTTCCMLERCHTFMVAHLVAVCNGNAPFSSLNRGGSGAFC
jgi:hypothetical protein